MNRLVLRLSFTIAFGIVVGIGVWNSYQVPPPKPPVARTEFDPGLGAGVPIRICRSERTRYITLDPKHPCTPMAALYADPDMKVPLANPVYTDPLGKFEFYAEPGYYRFEIGTRK